MYKAVVEIPIENGWVAMVNGIMPQDMEICVIVNKYGDKCPEIVQFRKADWLHSAGDYFLCVAEGWFFSDHEAIDDWNPTFIGPEAVLMWKPLNLPPAIDGEMQRQIKSWFKEDEEDEE